MSPNLYHERWKSVLGSLLEAYFQETRTSCFPLGSTTFRSEDEQGGTEPDECYCLGAEKEVPDLAIEVVVTSGGIDKLAVYKKLGVVEVWFWKGDGFEVHHLRDFHYERIPNSELLPELDLTLTAEYVKRSDILEAALEFREQIRAREI